MKRDLMNFVRTQKDKGRDRPMIADMIYFEYKLNSYQKALDITTAILNKISGVIDEDKTVIEEEVVYERENVLSPDNDGNNTEPILTDKPWLLQFKTFNVGSKKANEEMIYAQPIDAQQPSEPKTTTTTTNITKPPVITPTPTLTRESTPVIFEANPTEHLF